MYTSLTFLVSKMYLSTHLVQLISLLRAKLWMVVVNCENIMVFNFLALFLKIYIFEVFLLGTYPVNSIFSGSSNL